MSILFQHKMTGLKAPAMPFRICGQKPAGAASAAGRNFADRGCFGFNFGACHRPADAPGPWSAIRPQISVSWAGSAHRSCDMMKDIGHGKTSCPLQIESSHRLTHDDGHEGAVALVLPEPGGDLRGEDSRVAVRGVEAVGGGDGVRKMVFDVCP